MELIRLTEGMAMGAEGYLSTIVSILPLVLLFGAMYFFMIRPQRKRDKEEREMRNSIQVGDEISTIGGFIGRVVSIKDDILTIETSSDRTKLRMYRWAVRGKVTAATTADKLESPKE